MKSDLDIHSYQDWYLDNVQYREGLLLLTLLESERMAGKGNNPRQFIVSFSDAIQVQIYDECDHSINHHESREDGVIAKYKSSALLSYLKSETLIFDTTPGLLLHYSVMTGNEFVHVLTREAPKVINVT